MNHVQRTYGFTEVQPSYQAVVNDDTVKEAWCEIDLPGCRSLGISTNCAVMSTFW